MAAGIRATLVATALAVVLFALFPQLDLAVAALFYDPASRAFPAVFDERFVALRRAAMSVTAIVAAAAGIVLVGRMVAGPAIRYLPGRGAGYLLLSLALGPGLIVNGILKEHWDRVRPDRVLNEAAAFTPWWQPGGACVSNCSFVSGEAAGAFWLTAAAALLPRRWRLAGVVAALAYGIGIGLLRMAYGRHFLSDVVFAGLITIAVNLACYRLCFGAGAPLPAAWRRVATLAGQARRNAMAARGVAR